MSKKVLIRKQAGSGGIMYTREVGGRGQGGLMQDLAAVRGGAEDSMLKDNNPSFRAHNLVMLNPRVCNALRLVPTLLVVDLPPL